MMLLFCNLITVRDYMGIILVVISLLRPGHSGYCGTLTFDKPSYSVGSCASLIYEAKDNTANITWYIEYDRLTLLNVSSTSKYSVSENHRTLIINRIERTDTKPYIVSCGLGVYTDRAYLNISTSSDGFHCGQLEFKRPSVYKGETASLIYKPDCAMAYITWYKTKPGGHVLLYPNKTSESSTKYTEFKTSEGFILRISVAELADAGDYIVNCGKQSHHAKLNVLESIEIKAQPMKENVTSSVQCPTINVRPLTEALIYLNDKLQNSINITKSNKSGYTYNVTTTLWRKFTRQDNEASVHCCIDNISSVCSNKEYLNISFPPKSVFLTEITKVSAENGDTELVLKCDVDESNPKSIVSWQEVKNIPKQLLEEKYSNHTAPHGWTYTTSWKFNLTKDDRGRNITCQVKNSEFPHLVLQKSYRPNITYSPVIKTSENVIVFIGDNVMLSCNVDSNPPSVVTWYNKTNKIEESNGTNKLDLHLVNVTIEHSQTYTCKARNGIGETKSRDVTLTVNVGLIPSEKTYIQPSSEAGRFSLLVPVTGGASAIIIAIVIVVGFLTLRKKRNDAQPKRKGTQQIEDESRQESVNPARNEPLHNEIPASNEKEMDNAPEYACVIPKANRKYGTNELKPEDTPEYSGIIPKSKRKSEKDLLKSADGTEYACVIPKAQRKQEMDQRKSDGASAKSQGDTLVYAELDLNLDSGATTRRPLTKQYEPTEYVTIDFSKTVTIKIENEEIEKEPKIEHDEMAEEGVKKENKDHHHHHLQ